jgi:hypothetical protein
VTIVEDKRVRECGNFGEQRDEKSDKGQWAWLRTPR